MSKHKKLLRMIIVCLLVFSFVSVNLNSVVSAIADRMNSTIDIKSKIKFEDLSLSTKTIIDTSLDKCISDGDAAAEAINKLKGNTESFEIGVREILDKYYSVKKDERKELTAFSEKIDDTAKQILQNYQEAEAERDNKANLHFETEKVVVSFSHDTPMATIETIVSNEAVSYEIIDDGISNISEDLPEYKKKRLEKVKDWKSSVIILAEISLEDTVERAVEKFKKYDCVKSVSSNTYFDADEEMKSENGEYEVKTNDPNFNEEEQWSLDSIKIPRAWNRYETLTALSEVWVAVIDCGVQMDHPDLKNVLLRDLSVDVTRDNKKLIECDDSKQWKNGKGQYTGPHGTKVAGIIMAQGNNETLGAGVASVGSVPFFRNSCKLIAIKCDNTYEEDRHITQAFLAKAIYYAVDNGSDIINISYSAVEDDYSADDFTSVKNAVAYAIAADVAVVCSVGNDSEDSTENPVRYPAGFPGVIGVGASTKDGIMAEYSNQSSAVDIIAPGGSTGGKIFTTTPTTHNAEGYGYGKGTSCATPHVTGTIAMMKSINYTLTPAQLLTRLKNRSTSTIQGLDDPTKEFPFLNAGKSVALTDEPS